MSTPRVPTGLGSAGRELWRWAQTEFEFDVHERLLLVEACRCADRLDRLAAEALASTVTVINKRGDEVAHPAMVEARQQAIVQSRLVASLRLPSGESEGRPQRRGAARGAYQPRALSVVPGA